MCRVHLLDEGLLGHLHRRLELLRLAAVLHLARVMVAWWRVSSAFVMPSPRPLPSVILTWSCMSAVSLAFSAVVHSPLVTEAMISSILVDVALLLIAVAMGACPVW